MFQTSSPYVQSLYSNDSIRFQIKSHHYLQEISSKASTKALLHISMHNNVSGNNKSFFYFIILYFVIYFKSFWQHIERRGCRKLHFLATCDSLFDNRLDFFCFISDFSKTFTHEKEDC